MDTAWGRRYDSRRKREKCLAHFTEILVWDDDPPWTLPGVEGKKAEEKGKKFPTHFTEILL
jgi:hypothetical protein